MIFNKEDLINNGFAGFVKISDLKNNGYKEIPKIKGVYLILNLDNIKPEFLDNSIGGHFKGKDPTVSINKLKDNWVNNTVVLYIGKAGGEGSSSTLHQRLKQYIEFGKGKNIGHWGGRYIWQLKNSDDLVVVWKTLENEEPSQIELNLIDDFRKAYGDRPFANLTKGG